MQLFNTTQQLLNGSELDKGINMKSVLLLLLFASPIFAQSTVTYTKQGDKIVAVVFEGNKQIWDHYLNEDEAALLSTDPAILDAKLAVTANKQKPAPPEIKPTPVEVRRTIGVDVTRATTSVEAYDQTNKAIADGLQDLLKKVDTLARTLSIDARVALLKQVSDIVDALIKQ